MRKLYPLLVVQSSPGEADGKPKPKRQFQNLFQVLNSGLDLDPVAVQLMCKLLHKARLLFDLQTLRQQLLQKILDKMYSRRQKAREMLAGVAL